MSNYNWEEFSKSVDALGIKNRNGSIVKKSQPIRWFFVITLISFFVTAFFGTLSHFILLNAGLVLGIILILLLMLFNVLSDMLGMSVATASVKPIILLINKKQRGAKQALRLVLNAEKVSCICCDVIGDVCSILSGAAGAAITLVVLENIPAELEVLFATLVSSFIAAICVLGKAIGKAYVVNHSTEILVFTGKFLGLFMKKEK